MTLVFCAECGDEFGDKRFLQRCPCCKELLCKFCRLEHTEKTVEVNDEYAYNDDDEAW